MELFQTEILRKEYKDFVENTLTKTLECNYCNNKCCKNHYHFEVTCLNCRTERCSQCQIFNRQMDCLMKASNDKTKSFIYNFVINFFSLSSESLQFFYNINKKTSAEMDITDIIWKMKMYHGAKHQVTSLIKTLKFKYTIRKRRFMYLRN